MFQIMLSSKVMSKKKTQIHFGVSLGGCLGEFRKACTSSLSTSVSHPAQ